MGRLLLMAEGRGEVGGIHITAHRKYGNIAEIPMALVGMGKGVDLGILVFIPRTAAEFRDRTQLHHGVGHGCSRKNKSGPHSPGRFESDVRRIGQRSCSQEWVDVVHRPLLGFEAQSSGSEEQHQREKISFHQLALPLNLSLIHISEPTRQAEISYAVFCLKKKKK